MRLGLLLLGLLLPAGLLAFDPPSENERLAALGNRFELPASIRPLFTPDADFRPIPRPRGDDWLTWHTERGQTFDDYKAAEPNRPDATRRTIYLLPLGEFDGDAAPDLEALRAYAAAFFQLEARLLPLHDPHDLEFSPRKHRGTGRRQVRSTDILAYLKTRLPADAYCLIGVTMTDLYPEPSWNYVFGQASLAERVGIFSFARYDPAFFGEERGRNFRDLILQRSCKVLAHETAHMFGMGHCIYFDCLVNGSNSLAETDRQPQHLCPVCLRKLHEVTWLDPARRYRELGDFYRARQWFDDLDFVNRQLARLPAAADSR